jgi:NAD(P)-dependent dehydrogenase (short-subunit alcohol dehydrogenase family)
VAQSERKLIVTITSGMGSLADNTSGGAYAYRSSKAAVNMVMRSLAIDLAPRGIACVVINPGWVLTDMGGPHATLTTAESVKKLRRLIETLGPGQSGKFFNYDGANTPGKHFRLNNPAHLTGLIVGGRPSDRLEFITRENCLRVISSQFRANQPGCVIFPSRHLEAGSADEDRNLRPMHVDYQLLSHPSPSPLSRKKS